MPPNQVCGESLLLDPAVDPVLVDAALGALELEREDRRARNNDFVDAAAEARDVELETDPTRYFRQEGAEGLNLGFPGALLLRVEGLIDCSGEVTEDLSRCCGEEGPNVRSVEG